jgi:hypothetical protein
VVSAGAIALSPVQPLSTTLNPLPQKTISELAVGLAAAVSPVNPIQKGIDVITDSGANLVTLLNNWASGVYVDGTFPFPPNTGTGIRDNGNLGWRTGGYATDVGLPILNQFLSNVLFYLSELPDTGAIAGQVFDNIGDAIAAPFVQGVDQPGRLSGAAAVLGVLTNFNQNVNAIPYVPVPGVGTFSQRDIVALLPVLAAEAYAALEPVLDFATTPISGLLVGAVGPIVGPVLAVVNSLTNVFALLEESDVGGALTELVNIPATAVGAFLNGGQILDLTGLLRRLEVPLPSTITSVGLQLGGLLSPGGVALDGLATEASLLGASVTVAGLPVGPIGALSTLANYVATSIVVPAPVVDGVGANRRPAAAAVQASPAPVTELATPQAVTDVVPNDEPEPAPKRARRAATAKSAGAADTDGDAKPSRAPRRAG